MTFKDDILYAADGPIIGIVIGAFGWGNIADDEGKSYREHHSVPKNLRGVVLSWEFAQDLLDYSYDDGYGAPDCHAITAWTAERVISVSEYDGSTCVTWVPRNPVEHEPLMSGGG